MEEVSFGDNHLILKQAQNSDFVFSHSLGKSGGISTFKSIIRITPNFIY